jgi:mediator of DNA damage checkpoint protein 1
VHSITHLTGRFHADEEDYVLSDRANEKKFGFELAEALVRAKENKGRLFANRSFYVTPKVPADAKLLKNVVMAGGGQVSAIPLRGVSSAMTLSCSSRLKRRRCAS